MLGLIPAPLGVFVKQVATPGLVELFSAISRGDERALATLYDQTHGWIHGLCARIVGDEQAAEEVTLDAYMQVWRTAGSYEPGRGSPMAWLVTVARSRAIDKLRTLASRRKREQPFLEGFDAAQQALSPEVLSVDSEMHQRVLQAVSTLPREQSRAIELAFLQGLTHTEIAEKLKEPVGTVKTRIRLGMQKLRDILRPFGEQP